MGKFRADRRPVAGCLWVARWQVVSTAAARAALSYAIALGDLFLPDRLLALDFDASLDRSS